MEPRGTLSALSAADVRSLMVAYRDVLTTHQQAVNRLNVYPVPDGDTGTNMALTLEAVVAELEAAGEGVAMAGVCKAVGHGSLMGARGNSGVILSQLLRGIAERLGSQEQAGPADLAEALVLASDLARQAVVRPVEGTILTVARAAGEGAAASVSELGSGVGSVSGVGSGVGAASVSGVGSNGSGAGVDGSGAGMGARAGSGAGADGGAEASNGSGKAAGGGAGDSGSGGGAGDSGSGGGGDSEGGAPTMLVVAEGARAAAADALAHTPEMLEALARAGVVDAGGTGYLLLFDALLSVLDGRPLPEAPDGPVNGAASSAASGAAAPAPAPAHREAHRSDVSELRYEVMYLLHAPDEAIADFKEVWAGIGDSIVVVGGDGLYNCHIHTDDIGGAIEAACDVGTPSKIRVTDLADQVDQVEEERWVREGEAAGPADYGASHPPPETDVVAVVTGDGIGRIFRSLGVHHQVVGGQTMNPSTAQLLAAVDASASDQVVVLPNNSNIRPVAEQVDALTAKSVRVVPTGSTVEGFAALLAYDPAAGVEANEAAMVASAHRVVPAEVTRAVRDAHTDVGPVREGDWIGLCRDGVVSVGASVVAATCQLLAALLGPEHELVTLFEGEGATAGDTRRITEWVNDEHPEVATEVHHGGQPLYPYLLGIE